MAVDSARSFGVHTAANLKTAIDEPKGCTVAASEELHLRKCTPEMRAWYSNLKSFMLGLGHDVTFRPTNQYVGFWRAPGGRKQRIFAYVNFRRYSTSSEGPSGPHLTIDIPKLSVCVAYEPGLIQPSNLEGWKEDLERIWVDSHDDAERVKRFIAQAYEEV